jgi:hypothetical protein
VGNEGADRRKVRDDRVGCLLPVIDERVVVAAHERRELPLVCGDDRDDVCDAARAQRLAI